MPSHFEFLKFLNVQIEILLGKSEKFDELMAAAEAAAAAAAAEEVTDYEEQS